MSWAGEQNLKITLPTTVFWTTMLMKNVGILGFKKNVNRATTQVMMKTGA